MFIGDSPIIEFCTVSITATPGALRNADSTPIAVARRNGSVVVGAVITITNIGTGKYTASGYSFPSADGWIVGDSYSIEATYTMEGTANIPILVAQGLIRSSTNGILDVNASRVGGTAQTGLDIGGTWTAAKAQFLDASVASRSTYNGSDTSGTTTLLERLTAARAGYFDNLNVGGAVASQADINAINQSASRRVTLVSSSQFERPESGSNSYRIEARTYDGDGVIVDADVTPTLTATGIVSGSLAGQLSAAVYIGTGVYRWTYTVAANAAKEQIQFDLSATIGGSIFTLATFSQVTDNVALTWTQTDEDMLTALFNIKPDYKLDVSVNGAVKATDLSGDALATSAALADAQSSLDAVPAAVRDVNNANPAVDSLGASINARALPGDQMSLVSEYDAAKTAASATAVQTVQTDVTTILGRLGAFTGSGINTVLGFFRALLRKDASTPDDVGGTFTSANASLEAVRERGDTNWITATGFAVPGDIPTLEDIAARISADHGSGGYETATGFAVPGDIPTLEDIAARISADHGSGGYETATGFAVPGDIPTLNDIAARISADHGSGGYETATGFAVPGDIPTLEDIAARISADHGSGGYETATGFAVPGDAMNLSDEAITSVMSSFSQMLTDLNIAESIQDDLLDHIKQYLASISIHPQVRVFGPIPPTTVTVVSPIPPKITTFDRPK